MMDDCVNSNTVKLRIRRLSDFSKLSGGRLLEGALIGGGAYIIDWIL